jgi:branched-chain amino acid transport system permease protein
VRSRALLYNLRELVRPIGQLVVFSAGSALVLSIIALILALILDQTSVGTASEQTFRMNLLTFTAANLPQVVIDGLTIGFVYAAIALGYTMVYGVLEFINFAQRCFCGGASGVETTHLHEFPDLLSAPLWLAYLYLILAIVVGMLASGLLAVGIERTAYRPLRGKPLPGTAHSAIGVSFCRMPSVSSRVATGDLQDHSHLRQFRHTSSLGKVFIGTAPVNLGISVKSIIVTVAAVLMLVALNYLVNATKIGKAIRAVAQDRPTASLMGINVNRIISFTFLIGGLLGGAAGVLFALKFTRIDPFVGFFPGLKAFTAAVLGGIGNLTGALLGGIVLGLLETFSGAYMSAFTNGAAGAEYKDIFAFGVLILVLIFRPHGLMGEQVGQKA